MTPDLGRLGDICVIIEIHFTLDFSPSPVLLSPASPAGTGGGVRQSCHLLVEVGGPPRPTVSALLTYQYSDWVRGQQLSLIRLNGLLS